MSEATWRTRPASGTRKSTSGSNCPAIARKVGITDYAQQQLGDVVYIELPEVGATLKQGDSFGTIESVKAVSELYAPVSGEVVEVNTALKNKPETINANPHESWMVVVKLANSGGNVRAARRRAVRRSGQVGRVVMRPGGDFEPFQSRHIGPDPPERDAMLEAVGAASLDALMDETIPAGIRLTSPLNLPEGQPEHQHLRHLRQLAARNQLFTSLHRPRLLRLHHAERHPAQRAREPRLVYAVHALPGRDRAGPARGRC